MHLPAHADLVEIATTMADYNLATLPILDEQHRTLGVVTVDDVLEASIPANWRDREAVTHHHHADDTGSN